jgi:nucleoside-diphosphate-sugar epimerase
MSVNPRQVGSIVHSAAVTRFNVDETTAQSVNVEGTGKLLDFASQCDGLDSVAILSTVYASGLKPGLIEEKPFRSDWGFANHYERSKQAAEAMVLERYNHLPWRIFRVATVVSDNASGRVTQFNAFHNTLKLLYYGLMSLVPGRSSTPLYFLAGDFAVDAMYQAIGASPMRSFYHVAHTRQESITLGRLIDIAFEVFESQENFRLRRSLKPLYSDLESFEMLDSAIHGFGGGILNDALASVSPFARQLFVEKDVRNPRLASSLSRPSAPADEQTIRNVCRYLISTRWGSRKGADHVE